MQLIIALYMSTNLLNCQVFQTMLLANPYKIIAAREAKVQVEKDKIKAREKALKKARKK